MIPHVLSLAACLDAEFRQSGGKAHSLARLARFGLPVPDAVVVTAANYDALMQRPDIAAAFADIDLSRPFPDQKPALDALSAAIASARPDEAERHALRRALAQAGLARARLAVRSSAGDEDGGNHSFAGIHDSVLGVSGEEPLWQAIRHCQASFVSLRALSYRQRTGMLDQPINGAVLICEMVSGPKGEPAASGVLFTMDPTDGNVDSVLVEATTGLGDKLVSGSVTPERGHYDLRFGRWRDNTGLSEFYPEDAATALVRLALRARDALADGDDLLHYDIEWAWDGTRNTLLQARPITTRAASPLNAVPTIWSRANLVELFPADLGPLAWSLSRPGVRWALTSPFRDGLDTTWRSAPLVRMERGTPYMELSALQWLSYACFGIEPAELNRTLGGPQPEIDTGRIASPLSARIGRRLRLLRYGIGLTRIEKRLTPVFALSQDLERSFRATPPEDHAMADLAQWWLRIADFVMTHPLNSAPSAAVPWKTALDKLLAGRLSEAESQTMIGGLLVGQGRVASADHGYALQQLARIEDPRQRARALRDFLDTFGHRGFGELDVASPRWAEATGPLEKMIAALKHAPDTADRTASRRAEAETLLKKLPFPARRMARSYIARLIRAFGLREVALSESVRLLGMIRSIALEVGRRLAANGRIASPDDVFQLTIADLLSVLFEEWDGTGARALVAHRRALAAQWAAQPEPPFVYVEDTNRRPAAPPPVPLPGGKSVLAGLPVSPGQVRGTARVLRSPEEIDRFGQGDILVAQTTDPAWTPLFLLAGGVIVAHGGFLSHGAIVAREFGIPAVVNIGSLIARIRDGDDIVVDGTTGEVRRAEPA